MESIGGSLAQCHLRQTSGTITPSQYGQLHLGAAVVLVALQSQQVRARQGPQYRSARSLPVLDFRALTDEQLRTAEAIFNELRDVELKPAYLADADANRALLDRRVVCDLLGFDEEVYAAVRRLAAKWCAEPSVHGGKARPKDAKLVV